MDKNFKRRYKVVENAHLQAVHDDDLTTLLKSLGIYENVINHQCHCIFCNKEITIDNLGAIIPLNNKITFSCDTPFCLSNLTEEGQ